MGLRGTLAGIEMVRELAGRKGFRSLTDKTGRAVRVAVVGVVELLFDAAADEKWSEGEVGITISDELPRLIAEAKDE